MPITINKDKAIELLEAQVEKKGADYVYPYDSCVYFSDGTQRDEDTGAQPERGTPLCILGNVYADLGLTVADLRIKQYEDEGEYYGFDPKMVWDVGQDGALGSGLFDVRPDPEKVVITEEAEEVLRTAQTQQDHHSPWGAAVERAKEVAE